MHRESLKGKNVLLVSAALRQSDYSYHYIRHIPKPQYARRDPPVGLQYVRYKPAGECSTILVSFQ